MENTTAKEVPRRIQEILTKDLRKKMVLLSGPRQCGKTSLAQTIASQTSSRYFNWDIVSDRNLLKKNQMSSEKKLWIFDEIHKNRQWRNWLKGVYDEHHLKHPILVTGSARLDVYGRGGDSLQGRYYRHRLHPLTLSEVSGLPFISSKDVTEFKNEINEGIQDQYQKLFQLGGFPEPFTSGSEVESQRWRLSYSMRLVQEEIRSLEKIIELDKVETLYDQLSRCVGSPLSINSLREDLDVAFETVKNWIQVFDNIYATFRLSPFGNSKIKAVKKEQKLYFWDWAKVESGGYRAENLVAMHLLRFCHWIEDVEGQKCELRYYRSTIPHEVDFIILKKSLPWMAIEIKSSEESLHPGLKYLLERVKIPFALQLHHKGTKSWTGPTLNGTSVEFMPIYKFLAQLP